MSGRGQIIAVTGQSGSGKSTLSAFYSSKGHVVIDSDKVAKEVRDLPECRQELCEEFGSDILVNGRISPDVLSKKAFSDVIGVRKLTRITHPYIIRKILKRANSAFDKGEKMVFVDGAVIIGREFEKYCDKFIVVVVSPEIRVKRIVSRDKITFQKAMERISLQTPYPEMIKKADYVVGNNSAPEDLIVQGEFVYRRIAEK